MKYKKEFGNDGENIACNYLQKIGYEIIARNFSCQLGEIDIIAIDLNLKEPELVFIEVKTRSSTKCGNPAEAVTNFKIRHISRSAEYFMMKNHFENIATRFDVIEILDTFEEHNFINHIKNAFDVNY